MMSGIWKAMVFLGCLSLLLVAPSTAFASDDLDVTMRMVTDNDDLTESVVREINLREPLSLDGPPKGGAADKRANPESHAGGAREKGREAANAALERAREVRNENAGKGRPDSPGRPEVTNRPDRPQLP